MVSYIWMCTGQWTPVTLDRRLGETGVIVANMTGIRFLKSVLKLRQVSLWYEDFQFYVFHYVPPSMADFNLVFMIQD